MDMGIALDGLGKATSLRLQPRSEPRLMDLPCPAPSRHVRLRRLVRTQPLASQGCAVIGRVRTGAEVAIDAASSQPPYRSVGASPMAELIARFLTQERRLPKREALPAIAA